MTIERSNAEAIQQEFEKIKKQMTENISILLANELRLEKIQDDSNRVDKSAKRYAEEAKKLHINMRWRNVTLAVTLWVGVVCWFITVFSGFSVGWCLLNTFLACSAAHALGNLLMHADIFSRFTLSSLWKKTLGAGPVIAKPSTPYSLQGIWNGLRDFIGWPAKKPNVPSRSKDKAKLRALIERGKKVQQELAAANPTAANYVSPATTTARGLTITNPGLKSKDYIAIFSGLLGSALGVGYGLYIGSSWSLLLLLALLGGSLSFSLSSLVMGCDENYYGFRDSLPNLAWFGFTATTTDQTVCNNASPTEQKCKQNNTVVNPLFNTSQIHTKHKKSKRVEASLVQEAEQLEQAEQAEQTVNARQTTRRSLR